MNEDRLECFGDANMSDACAQCPDNEECVRETIRRWKQEKLRSKIRKIVYRMQQEVGITITDGLGCDVTDAFIDNLACLLSEKVTPFLEVES